MERAARREGRPQQFNIPPMQTPANPIPGAIGADIRFVLVGTQHPGNIGAAARALKTMGLSTLVLVAPEDHPTDEAFRRAAGADDVLAAAPVFATLAEAVADCRFVLGCTARSRRVQLDEHDPRAAGERTLALAGEGPVALVFGRERTGLTNDELQLCHAAVHIPANPEYSSLNLAAAVQVLAYEVRMAWLARQGRGTKEAKPVHPDEVLASHTQLEGFFAQLGEMLEEIDFHKGRTPDSAMRKLRRLYLRADLREQEVRLLRGILADAQRMARIATGR